MLFEKSKSTINEHILNIFKERELDASESMRKIGNSGFSTKPTNIYNLDVIISVGYRVKSHRGTRFRQWATGVLREKLLHKNSVNVQLFQIESRLESKIADHTFQIADLKEKVDFFVRTSIPPVEGLFFEGQVFEAWTFASDLVRFAKRSIVLVDNFVDDQTLKLLEKRLEDASVEIYTRPPKNALDEDLRRFQQQFYPIPVHFTTKVHDRFMLLDGEVYHVGASFKDLGKKLFAFSKLNDFTAEDVLAKLR